MVGELTYRKGWEMEGSGSVNSLAVYDLLRTGVPVIIVGRENGSLEIYGFDSPESVSITPPQLLYSCVVPEPIYAVGGGILTSPSFDEVVIMTFSGKIIGFTTETFQEEAVSSFLLFPLPSLPARHSPFRPVFLPFSRSLCLAPSRRCPTEAGEGEKHPKHPAAARLRRPGIPWLSLVRDSQRISKNQLLLFWENEGDLGAPSLARWRVSP
jgi:hypothetical protein